jgi:hypothetical protein
MPGTLGRLSKRRGRTLEMILILARTGFVVLVILKTPPATRFSGAKSLGEVTWLPVEGKSPRDRAAAADSRRPIIRLSSEKFQNSLQIRPALPRRALVAAWWNAGPLRSRSGPSTALGRDR